MKNEGVLEWKHLEDSFAEELALTLDEDAEKVEQTLAYLKKAELAEEIDEEYLRLPYALKCTGSEGASAERVRNSRQRKQMQEADAAVAASNDADSVTLCANSNGDREKEEDNKFIKKSESSTIATNKNNMANDTPWEQSSVDVLPWEEKPTVTYEDLQAVLDYAKYTGFPDDTSTYYSLKGLTRKYGQKLMIEGMTAAAMQSNLTIPYLVGCLKNMVKESAS